MENLAQKKCIPCSGDVPRLKGKGIYRYLQKVKEWKVINEHHLTRQYTFPDFKTALDFVNKVGSIAERENHHPDICLSWGEVSINIYTHKIDGLFENDFILAAKIDQIS
jgi:4a-hydroxytetrahydrobiopterin dehydratase